MPRAAASRDDARHPRDHGDHSRRGAPRGERLRSRLQRLRDQTHSRTRAAVEGPQPDRRVGRVGDGMSAYTEEYVQGLRAENERLRLLVDGLKAESEAQVANLASLYVAVT